MNSLRCWAFLCCCLLSLLASQRSFAQRDAWIATWTASPEPADPDASLAVLGLQGSACACLLAARRFAYVCQTSTAPPRWFWVRSPWLCQAIQRVSNRVRFKPLISGGRNSITIPSGAPALSDPVAFPVAFGAEIGVSLYFPKPVKTPTWHALALKRAVVSKHGDRTHEEKIQGGTQASSFIVLSAVLVPA